MHDTARFKESIPVIPSMTTAIIPTSRRVPANTCNHFGMGQPRRTHDTMHTTHATKTMPFITCQATEIIRDSFSYTGQLIDSVHPWGPDGLGMFDFPRLFNRGFAPACPVPGGVGREICARKRGRSRESKPCKNGNRGAVEKVGFLSFVKPEGLVFTSPRQRLGYRCSSTSKSPGDVTSLPDFVWRPYRAWGFVAPFTRGVAPPGASGPGLSNLSPLGSMASRPGLFQQPHRGD